MKDSSQRYANQGVLAHEVVLQAASGLTFNIRLSGGRRSEQLEPQRGWCCFRTCLIDLVEQS